MSDQFVAEIKLVGFNFAPTGYALCNGQLLPIAQNTALFSLLGTVYGGNGVTTFGLPNLQGSAPLHVGSGQGPGLSPYALGETGGEVAVTLTAAQLPVHTHTANAATAGGSDSPSGSVWASGIRGRSPAYTTALGSDVPMSASAMGTSGGGQPHNNMPPYLTLNFIIALTGIFPSH